MRKICLVIVLTCTGLAVGCKPEYEALPDTVCPKLVVHTRALFGAGVEDKTDLEMLAVCKASKPKQRGCAMASTKASDMMKCSLVTD